MPSGLKGYNIRLDGVKLNSTPIPEAGSLPIAGLASGTNYAPRITISAVDNAGNETTPVTLASLGLTVATSTPGASDPLPQSTRDAIDGFVAQKLKPNTRTDGCVLGIYTPTGSYYKAYGGDRTAGLSLTIDHKMRYGSITKMYTGILVCRQIDLGRISLDDKLTDYVSGGPDFWNRITIKHLLMMQSGILDYLQQDGSVQQAYFLSPTATFDPMSKIPTYTTPLFEPGTSASYSNSNWVLLGKILEWVDAHFGTGRDIRTIMIEDCLQPLGLADTEWPTGNYLTPAYARGWTDNIALPTIQSILGPFAFLAGLFGYPTAAELEFTAASTTWGGAAGALGGTISDLVKFGRAIATGALLSPQMKQLREEEFTTYAKYVPANPWEGPGWMGFGLGVVNWGRWLGWVGNLAGYIAVMFANPESGAVVAVILNNMQANTIDLFYRIAYLLDPASTLAIKPMWVRSLAGAASPRAFGPMAVYRWAPKGDSDGATQVPHKVPFTL